jgi:hypothetical protein
MVQNIDLYGLSKDYYKTYVGTMMKVTPEDVQRMAQKYLNTGNVAFLAVGDASVIREPLAALGEVRMYDPDMNPVSATKTFAVDIDAPALLEKSIEAMGGRAALEKVTSRITEGDVTMSFGPASAEGTFKEMEKAPNKKYQLVTLSLDMGGGAQILEMEQWVNGDKAWVRQPMQPMQELSGDDLAKALESEQFNAVLRWKELGFEPTVTEKKEMNGRVVYVLSMKKKHSMEEMFIDAENFRMVAKSETNDTPQGPVSTMTTYGDYRPVDGLMLPHSLLVEGAGMTQKATVTSYKQNVAIDDSEFSVKN